MSKARPFAPFLLLAAGCAAPGGQGGSWAGGGDGPRLELSATRTERCVPLRTRWTIEGSLRGAEVFRTGGKFVLVYETLMRQGPRTVWQSLRDDLAFDGDGVVVGLKGLPFVADFRVQNDVPGNTWVTYRAKAPRSELYGAYIELLPAREPSRILRVRVPTGPSESVQEVWLLPSPSQGAANVVVRTNPYAEQGEEQSVFRWYAVNAAKGTSKVMGEYRATAETLSNARFVSLAGTGEPVAFAVVSQNRDFDAADPKWQKASFRILARRLFARAKEEVVLHESNAPLGALTLDALPGAQGGFLLAWIQEPSGGENTILRWVPLRFDPSEKGFAAFKKSLPQPLRSPAVGEAPVEPGDAGTDEAVLMAAAVSPGTAPARAPKALPSGATATAASGSSGLRSLEVDHDPVRLKLRPMRFVPQGSGAANAGQGRAQSNSAAYGLTWWTASDEDSGYLMTQVFPSAPEITVDEGYDSKGQPKRRVRPATVGVYAPGRRSRIVGVAEAAGPSGADVLIQTEGTGERSVESGTTVSLCAIAGR